MWTAAVVTVSDRCSAGQRQDEAGPRVREMLEGAGFAVQSVELVPDEQPLIEALLCRLADEDGVALVVTTGGTGFSPRDVTPEATLAVCPRRADGLAEAMRAASLRITPRAMLSRAAAGLRGGTLMLNLPGSPKAAAENLAAVLDALPHGLQMLRGGPADCTAENGACP